MKTMIMISSAAVLLMGASLTWAATDQAAGQATAAQSIKKQTSCPIMGGKIDPSIYADANGKRVYFCCNGCPATFKKDPAKYIKQMEKEGITLEATPAGDQPKSLMNGCPASAKTEGCCK